MLAIVGGVLVALYLGVFLGPSATPKLGLDLRGGTQIILVAHPATPGGKVSKDNLSQAVEILRQRIDSAGVGGASITTQGTTNIVVSAPGVPRSKLKALQQTALLNFRQVLAQDAGSSTVTTPTTAPTPSSSPTPSPTKKPAPKKKSSHDI